MTIIIIIGSLMVKSYTMDEPTQECLDTKALADSFYAKGRMEEQKANELYDGDYMLLAIESYKNAARNYDVAWSYCDGTKYEDDMRSGYKITHWNATLGVK